MTSYPALRELAEKATAGPWRAEIGRWVDDAPAVGFRIDSDYRVPTLPEDMRMHAIASANMGDHASFTACFSAEEIEANANFIAAANPTAILDILDKYDAALAEIDRLKEALNAATHSPPEQLGGPDRRSDPGNATATGGEPDPDGPLLPEEVEDLIMSMPDTSRLPSPSEHPMNATEAEVDTKLDPVAFEAASRAAWNLSIGSRRADTEAKAAAIIRAYLSTLQVQTSEAGWVDHTTGKMPVEDDAMVSVRFRNGSEYTGRARKWDWHVYGTNEIDIVAYQVIPRNPSQADLREALEKIVLECSSEDEEASEQVEEIFGIASRALAGAQQ